MSVSVPKFWVSALVCWASLWPPTDDMCRGCCRNDQYCYTILFFGAKKYRSCNKIAQKLFRYDVAVFHDEYFLWVWLKSIYEMAEKQDQRRTKTRNGRSEVQSLTTDDGFKKKIKNEETKRLKLKRPSKKNSHQFECIVSHIAKLTIFISIV